MATQAGDTEIANLALMMLGSSTRLASIDAGSTVAAMARDSIAMRVDELLEQHNWNFAVTRQSLPTTATEAGDDAEYPYAIDLPPDCLRWIPWREDEVHYFRAEREGNRLLVCEAGNQLVRYVARVIDRTQWSALFRRALAAQVASDLAEAVAADKGSRDRAQQQYEDAMAAARRADTLETGRHDRPPPHRLSRAIAAMGRYGGRDPGRYHQ